MRPGDRLGDRFDVLGVLGRGGMASVHLAHDTLRDERVALKVLHPHLASDPAMRARLRREVQAARVLRTESALVPYDLHEIDELLVLTMPYHPGRTLTEHVATRGALPDDEVRTLGIRARRGATAAGCSTGT